MTISRETFSAGSGDGPRELWLEAHGGTVAAVLVVVAFLVRLWTAHGIFLNPDEALHFRLANQASLLQAYQQSLTSAHPPLLIVMLYYWRMLGSSELWLRLPAVISGVVFCWVFFKWVERVAGKLAALVGLALVASLPPVVLLSAEVRQYGLLIAFLVCALYFLELAFAKNSAGWMCAASVCLYLGILTHYSAVLFAAGLGVYALLKIFVPERPRAGVIAVWAAGQVIALALIATLYKTHLAKLGAGQSRSPMQGWMSEYYLHNSYFERGHDNPFAFAAGHSFGVFQFFFGQLVVGDLAAILFAVTLAMLLWGKFFKREVSNPQRLGIFFLTLFAAVVGASLAHVYPYGGTRQVALLVIPAIACVGVGLAWCVRWRAMRAAVLTGIVIVACLAGKARQPAMNRHDQSIANMQAAVEFTRNAPGNDTIFVDYQTDLMLGHYLCDEKPIPFANAAPQFEEFSCGGHRVICADYKTAWMFSADNFPYEWQQLMRQYRFNPGDTVWIFQSGWGINLPVWLKERYPEFHDLQHREFGRNIKIFKLAAGQTMPAVTSAPAAEFTAPAISGPTRGR